MTHLLAPLATGAVLSLALIPLCRRLAVRHGCVAHPAADRWHRRPVPLFGGVAIAGATLLGLLIVDGALRPAVVAGGAAALFTLGMIDDVRPLNASTRLVGQFVVASAFVFLGYTLPWTGSQTGDAILTLLWVVGITNAFNLLDNIDGLCAGVAVIAGAALLAILAPAADSPGGIAEVRYLACLTGAAAGFLACNRKPASIFMGDAGSLFIGSSFAVLTLAAGAPASGPAGPSVAAVAVPVLVLLVPLLDTALVTSTRLLAARSALAGGRDHASHRLVALGLSEQQAVVLLWGLAAAAGGAGWSVARLDASWSVLLTSGCLLGALVFGIYLARVDTAADEARAPGDRLAPGGDRHGPFEPVHGDEGRAPRDRPPRPAWSAADAFQDARSPMPGAGRTARPPRTAAEAFAEVRAVAEPLLDFGLIVVAYYAAYRLRFEGAAFDDNFGFFLQSLPVVVACQLAALVITGAYRTAWGHVGLMDTVLLGRAVAGGTAAAVLVMLSLYRFAGYSRTVFLIDGVLLLLALVATRASQRLIGELVDRSRRSGDRLVVYGADEAGQIVLRELLRRFPARYRMIGFIDDAPRLPRRVQGHAVLGDRGRLLHLVRTGQVEAVALRAGQGAAGSAWSSGRPQGGAAGSDAQGATGPVDELRQACERHGVRLFEAELVLMEYGAVAQPPERRRTAPRTRAEREPTRTQREQPPTPQRTTPRT